MVTWTLSVDRRKAQRAAIIAELDALAEGVQDLTIEVFAEDHYWNAADHGAFRDFVPFATLSHPHAEGLEYVAEALLESFGWLVDFRPPEVTED
ncbi:hypothetical protein [Bradymonas sediminis]|uniref:Uncharacterized protein n=1 Tax=Bradymonas sediminis TaxID=1548548 RepID=A0A2Z4FP15_9DELT|nr:hypothetical protein [Bradymonas sediminis]AWV90632.1 hypothetical protein DN745_15400 [Bradymonas sediminis]TDP62365.1 hypothetical protein DFR33_11328 [Bradymonas sediminis]